MDSNTINNCIDRRKELAIEAITKASDNNALDDAIYHVKVIKDMHKTVKKMAALDDFFFMLTDMVPPTEEEKQWRRDDRRARLAYLQNLKDEEEGRR